MDQKLTSARSQLIKHLAQQDNYDKQLSEIVLADVRLQDKLEEISITWMRQEDLRTENDLHYLVSAVRYLTQLAVYVLPKDGITVECPPIPVSEANMFRQKTMPYLAEFSQTVIKKLGYSKEKDGYFVRDEAANQKSVKTICTTTVDLIIVTRELELYLEGQHPNAVRIQNILPQAVRNTLRSSTPWNVEGAQTSPPGSTRPALLNNMIYDVEQVPTAGDPSTQKKPPPVLPKPTIKKNKALDITGSGQTDANPMCNLCSKTLATVLCTFCDDNKLLCNDCDRNWHTHHKQCQHQREPLVSSDKKLCLKQVKEKLPQPLNRTRNSVVIVPGKMASKMKETAAVDKEAAGQPNREMKKNVSYMELVEELEKESDLKKRSQKIMALLQKSEQRLGGIHCGLEVTSVKERIQILREQEFLRNYKASLESNLQQAMKRKNSYLVESPISCERANQKVSSAHCAVNCNDVHSKDGCAVDEDSALGRKRSDCPEMINHSDVYEVVEFQKPDFSLGGEASDGSQNDSKLFGNRLNRSSHSLPQAPGACKVPIKKSVSAPDSDFGSWERGWSQPWECQHCTFHNVKGSRVCAVCCKTSNSPVFLMDSAPCRLLPSPPAEHVLSPKGKSMETLDALDNLAIMQKSYSKGAQSASHRELISKLDEHLQNGNMGIFYAETHHRSARQKQDSRESNNPACQLMKKLKEAEKGNYTLEEFMIGKKQSGDMDPCQWLRTVWNSKVKEVIDRVLEKITLSHKMVQFSQEEGRYALIQADGNVEEAVQIAVKSWMQMYEELISNFIPCGLPKDKEKELVIRAMNKGRGDIGKSSLELFHETKAQPMLDSVWCCDDDIYTYDELLIPNKPYHLVIDEKLPKQKRVRILMAEFNLDSYDKANNVLLIWSRHEQLTGSVTISDVIEAVRNCGTVTRALTYLQQECSICEGKFPASQIQILSFCQCKLCTDCMKQYFSLAIKEKQVRDLVCPKCRKPDVSCGEQFSEHLQLLQLMLKHHLPAEYMNRLEEKLTHWNLMQDPNFRWCSYDDCGCGFIFMRQHPGELVMECPECGRPTCFRCKKPWLEEHAGITCEEFEQRQQTLQRNAKHRKRAADVIQDCGLDCPKCNYRYAIAKGGCMHFVCHHCQHEFCSGCKKTFHRGRECGLLESCANLGLHCHHPRSCFYYLRNESVTRLQKLLRDHGISPEADRAENSKTCLVMELKDSNKDEPCGKQVLGNRVGLCEEHCKEYLVFLINKHDIDPADMMTTNELQIQFLRSGKKTPEQNTDESLQDYHSRLLKLVKEQIPLSSLKRPSAVLP